MNSITDEQQRENHPIENASFFSRCTFSYAYPLLKLGLKRPIEDKDLPHVHNLESSDRNRRLIESIWENECKRYSFENSDNNDDDSNGGENSNGGQKQTKKRKKRKKKNLGRALFWYYVKSTWWAQCLLAMNMIARISQAVVLGLLMEQFGRYEVPRSKEESLMESPSDYNSTNLNDNDDSDESSRIENVQAMYLYAILLVVCGLIAFPTKQQQFFETYRKGVQLRLGLIAAIYAKTLRLPSINIVSTTSKNGDTETSTFSSSGHVTNLVSNDVERFAQASVVMPFLLHGPMIGVAILIVGIFSIGPVFAVGYVLLFLLLPLQVLLGRRFVYFRSQVASLTDKRVTLVSQAVSGARVMKMNGWELEFESRIAKLRSEEISVLQKASNYKSLNEALYYFSAPVISVFVFIVHILAGGELSPKLVYSTLTLMGIVQFIITKNLPMAVMNAAECYVACNRIQAFFELPDKMSVQGDRESIIPIDDICERMVLCLDNVTCFWNKDRNTHSDTERVHLLDETDEIMPMVALSNISLKFQLGQLYCIIGKVGCGKSALLKALAGELQIDIGSRIANCKSMSYAAQEPWIINGSVRENIVMGLDFNEQWYQQVIQACGLGPDICSFHNGDLTVVGDRGLQCSGGQRSRIGLARALYNDADVCLLDDPLSAVDVKVAKTIFYSAIQDLALKRNRCVILVTHQLQFVGSAKCILMGKSGKLLHFGSFSDCIEASKGEMTPEMLTVEYGKVNDDYKEVGIEPGKKNEQPKSQIIKKEENIKLDGQKSDLCDQDQRERRDIGIISLQTWISYGAALGGFGICFLLLSTFAIAQASLLLLIVFLGKWAEAPVKEQYTSFWIVTIVTTTGCVIVFSIFRANLSFYKIIKTSQRLHDKMLRSVLRAKIEFFDTNPLGRILNRFSADVGILDEIFPFTIHDFVVGASVVVGSIITAGIVLPFILLVIPPLILVFVRLRRVFISTSRELKRLEGIARSPIYAMTSESLSGIATIRTNSKIEYFMHKFESVHDAHTRAHFAFIASSRWFAFKLDILSFTLLSSASVFAVLFQHQGWFDVDPTILGLALTLLIQISTTNFPWVVRQSAEVVNQMVSVERILEYGSLPSEAALETDVDKTLENWPEKVNISVQHYSTRYRESLPLVLSDVSFEIDTGERVGVVGRSGSGKSSLVQTFFRLLEAEKGTIKIGDIDISKIGLHKLRSTMAVIPQTPVLFSGYTILENLDPFGKCKTSDIIDSLKAVQMYDAINDLPIGLETPVHEGGTNFSVGQRQLLCLARAILAKSQILVLDEPTANVDSNTDSLLQKTLRELFSEATIIMVAHRLQTIIDFDRVLVLGGGKILEYGSPKVLMQKEDGLFQSMLKNSSTIQE